MMMTQRPTLLIAGLLSAALVAGCTGIDRQLVSDEEASGYASYSPSPLPADDHGGDGHSD